MPDLLKSAQALDALMDGQDFISVNWPEAVRFRKAVKAATEEAAQDAAETLPAPEPAPAVSP